jgi:hypothetical protein
MFLPVPTVNELQMSREEFLELYAQYHTEKKDEG